MTRQPLLAASDARRSADARSDIQHRHISRDAGQFCQIRGRGEATGVKLVETRQLLRRQPRIFRSEHRQRRLEPLGQAGRTIMVAHAIKLVFHDKTPFGITCNSR